MNDQILSFADGVQTVILRRPGSDGEWTIPDALLRRFRSRRVSRAEENTVPVKTSHWYLPQQNQNQDQMPTPRPGDELEDAEGNVWTILEVNRSELNHLWQCVARCYAVSFGLDEYADHLRISFTKTPAGTLQKGFQVLKSGVAAKFSASTESLQNKPGTFCYALTREKLHVESGDALRCADGTIYEIQSVKSPLYPSGWTEMALKRLLSS